MMPFAVFKTKRSKIPIKMKNCSKGLKDDDL